MTQAEVFLVLIGAAGAAGTILAVILSNRDTKRTLAESWGKFQEKVTTQGERLDKAEERLDKHETRISRMEGQKANGAYN